MPAVPLFPPPGTTFVCARTLHVVPGVQLRPGDRVLVVSTQPERGILVLTSPQLRLLHLGHVLTALALRGALQIQRDLP